MSSKEALKVDQSLDQWISWTAATLIAAISMVVFLYTNFQTKVASDERSAQLEKHLDRIEGKLDQMILNQKD